jgi:spore maturation protein CgeB
MKPARAYAAEFATLPASDKVSLVEGRGGEPTIKSGGMFLHSRYQPREEAAKFVDSAELDLKRPVAVIGCGLGYHVAELESRGVTVAVVEPDPAVAALAVKHLLRDSDVPLAVGDIDGFSGSDAFHTFARKVPQVLIHPATARIHPEYCAAAASAIAKAALQSHRLRIAVVGPMYGGSLPIAAYLERAFRKLGHVGVLIDNAPAWDLYKHATESVKNKPASAQLGNMFSHFLGEWTYGRVVEFAPDICIVMAQAPVGPKFALRLSAVGVVTAFWYVENWRHLPYWKQVAPYYDCFFHIQPGEFEQRLTDAGCPCHAYVQTACDPEVHKPATLSADEQSELACDLSFAGAGYYNRIQMFKGLTDYDFKIWGVDWVARELAPLLCRPGQRFTPELFAKIASASKINLNLHSSTFCEGVDPHCDAINPRVFEIAACGAFQLCDPCLGLDKLFDFDTELPVYRDLRALRAKIDHFLENPDDRTAFAQRARARALRDHTYENRAAQMLDILVDKYGARILRKGIRIQRTVSEMVEKAGADTPLGKYLAGLPQDVIFTQENINNQLAAATRPSAEPEKIFAFLREVRNFTEMLLEYKS